MQEFLNHPVTYSTLINIIIGFVLGKLMSASIKGYYKSKNK